MISLDDLPMRVGLGQIRDLTDDVLQFIKQCGCDDFQVNTPYLPGDERLGIRRHRLAGGAGPKIRSAAYRNREHTAVVL